MRLRLPENYSTLPNNQHGVPGFPRGYYSTVFDTEKVLLNTRNLPCGNKHICGFKSVTAPSVGRPWSDNLCANCCAQFSNFYFLLPGMPEVEF